MKIIKNIIYVLIAIILSGCSFLSKQNDATTPCRSNCLGMVQSCAASSAARQETCEMTYQQCLTNCGKN